MKRFAFRLQALLRLRRLYEQEALLELQRRQAALAGAQQRLREMHEERRAWAERYNAQIDGPVAHAAADRLLIEQYFVSLDRQEILQHQEIERHAENVRQAQQIFEEKMREREQVDRLRQRALDEYQVELGRSELRDIDALNAVRFVRRRHEGAGYDRT